jgi:uncharacterized protein YdaU (DUF1376 family)
VQAVEACLMGQIKWYKRDPSAALNGMMELDLQERGAYNTVLDLIYSRDGNLPDDDRFIAGWLRVDVRVWKRIKSTLIERGKLFVQEGLLRNERADVEVLAALSRVASASDAGLASARSRGGKLNGTKNENSHLASTDVPTDVSTTVSTNHNHNQKEVIDANASIAQNEVSGGQSEAASKNLFGEPDPPPPPELKPEHFVEAWNDLARDLGKRSIRDLTPERRQTLKARINGYSLDDFMAVLGSIRTSPFLRGDTGWRGCTFDWVIKKANFQKILEGNYND